MQYTLHRTTREVNDHGCGFNASVYVDQALPHLISFDFAYVSGDLDADDDEHAVGVLMTPEAARDLARNLTKAANKIDEGYDHYE